MTNKELKKELVKEINSKGTYFKKYITNPRRLETICRSQINRPSYTMHFGDRCIYLEKDGRKRFIESRCNENKGDGFGRPAYITAFNEAQKIIEKLKVLYEETLYNNQQAV